MPSREPTRYHDLTFDEDFLAARRDNGEAIRLSRLERALLLALTSRPGRLFSRDHLISAMRGEGETVGDRSIDFVINRLRKKLRDPARAPRFIRTQYGEGYIWIAPASCAQRPGFLMIGPVRGRPTERQALIDGALERLHVQLTGCCAVGQEIALDPAWSRDAGASGGFRFSASADFMQEAGCLHAAFSLRDEADGRVIRVLRCELGDGDLDEVIRDMAERLASALRRHLLLASGEGLLPAAPPLDVRFWEVALTFADVQDLGWRNLAAQVASDFAAAPDDPELAALAAVSVYTGLRCGAGPDPADAEACRRVDDEIERLALHALSRCRDPIARLGAAKLLFFVHRGHIAQVERVAVESLAEGTTFAASLALCGQIQGYRGDPAGALARYEQALALCAPASEFEAELQQLRGLSLIAAGDRAGAAAAFRRMAEIRPALHTEALILGLPDADTLPSDALQALRGLSQDAARRALASLTLLTARWFGDPVQAQRITAGPLRHLSTRFGPSVLPERSGPAIEVLAPT